MEQVLVEALTVDDAKKLIAAMGITLTLVSGANAGTTEATPQQVQQIKQARELLLAKVKAASGVSNYKPPVEVKGPTEVKTPVKEVKQVKEQLADRLRNVLIKG